jgi:hypothetical protein
MADTHVALEFNHMASAKHVPHQTVVLSQVDPIAIAGDDTGGILATVLYNGQAVVDRLIDRLLGKNADYAAHEKFIPLVKDVV